MTNMKRFSVVLVLAILVACTPPNETFRLEPVADEESGVSLEDARGYPIAVSHQNKSDVSVFGIVRGAYIIVWMRVEYYDDKQIEVGPGVARLAALENGGRYKDLKIFSDEPGRGSMKDLEGGLSGAYQRLSGGEGSIQQLQEMWKEESGVYQSIRQVLLQTTRMKTNDVIEGYLVAPYAAASRYRLLMTVGGNVHRFDLVPNKKQ